MKKIFTFAAAVLASVSLWATAVADLNFSEPTVLPEGYVYSSTNTPVIATIANKSAVYVTNGGGGTVTAACFSEDGLVASQGKRWMGFVTDETSTLVLSVYSGKKTWTLYNSNAEAQSTFTNTTNNSWEEWTIENLPAGAYILTTPNSQCYVSAMTFTGGTPSTDPVESAVISGENACALGGSVELTCTAAKATAYQWSMNGAVIDGATAKKYTFTPTAAGTFSFTCAASNQYNNTPVVADAFVVTVTDPADACGELIRATHTAGKTATVTGVLGGTADKNTQDNGKLGSNGHYFGIKLASGNFMAGDEVTIVASALNGGNTATIYSDKGTTLLGSADFATESLTATYTLEDNVEWVYVYRTSSACNPNIEYISVTRSCEASSNANIKSLTINGEAVEAVEGVYSYTVGASVNLAAVEVVYTLAHPKATATPASGFTVNVPAAGADANTQIITVTAQDGTQANYTVSVAKSIAANTDATLSALSIDGYTLSPAFDANVLDYTITKAYGAENPAATAIHATLNDINASALIMDAINNVFRVVTTAEDGTTTLTYTITVVEAAAKKELLEVRFSNNVHGFIANGNINVPYLAGEAAPVYESVTFWQADGEPTAAIVEGNLVVTGIDGQADTYTITYVAVSPMAPNYEEITFDGTEIGQFIYSVYGWDEGKGIKFSKDVEEVTNRRVSEGKDRICMALPRALSITLTSGSGANRPVKIWVNGSRYSGVTKTAAAGSTIQIPLDGSKDNFLVIESDKNNGDAGFTKMLLEQSWATGIDNVQGDKVQCTKVIENGQLFIIMDGVKYNAQGVVVK